MGMKDRTTNTKTAIKNALEESSAFFCEARGSDTESLPDPRVRRMASERRPARPSRQERDMKGRPGA